MWSERTGGGKPHGYKPHGGSRPARSHPPLSGERSATGCGSSSCSPSGRVREHRPWAQRISHGGSADRGRWCCSIIRPVLAWILFGLLAYKPQFGLMIPLVLVATGRWRTCAAAAATVAALAAVTTLAFGIDASASCPRVDRVHPRSGARRRQYRLAQDPERLFLGAHVGRGACRLPMRRKASPPPDLPACWSGFGAGRRPFRSRPPRSVSRPSLRPHTASITIWW